MNSAGSDPLVRRGMVTLAPFVLLLSAVVVAGCSGRTAPEHEPPPAPRVQPASRSCSADRTDMLHSASAQITQTAAGFDSALDAMLTLARQQDCAAVIGMVTNRAIPYATRLDAAVRFGDCATDGAEVVAVFSALWSNACAGFETQRARIGLANHLIRRFAAYEQAVALLQANLAEEIEPAMRCTTYAFLARAYGRMQRHDDGLAAALQAYELVRGQPSAKEAAVRATLAAAYACKAEFTQAEALRAGSLRLAEPGSLEHVLWEEIKRAQTWHTNPSGAYPEFELFL